MDKLWAPWRIKYVRLRKHKGCVFCRAASAGAKDYVVFRTKYSLCMLNIFPYNNGHLMVSPLRHIKEPARLRKEERLDLFEALTRVQKLLGKILKPEGYNIGINISRSGGAGKEIRRFRTIERSFRRGGQGPSPLSPSSARRLS